MAAGEAPLNPPLSAYQPAALAACRRALGSIVKALGVQDFPYLVVIGGLVPNLLFGNERSDPLIEPATDDLHPGTNDVDFCVQLDVPEDSNGLYQRLEQVLCEYGFKPLERHNKSGDVSGPSIWQWVLDVDNVTVAVEFLAAPDDLMVDPKQPVVGRLGAGEHTRSGDNIGALRIPGAGLAHLDPRSVLIDIELLQDKGTDTVQVWVANILPFVALKSLAIRNRSKDKDTFDLIWVLNHWPGGPAAAASEALKSPVADHADVEMAIEYLRTAFGEITYSGCVRYADFSLSSGNAVPTADVKARLRRFAQGTVKDFLGVWDVGRTGNVIDTRADA